MKNSSFHSGLAHQFEAFVISRKASRRWNKGYEDNLHFFDNYCAKYYPGQSSLCEGMLDWCKERPTEHGNSCKYRISVIARFVTFANKEGWTTIAPPTVPSQKPCLFIPHAFSKAELSALFVECDKHFVEARKQLRSKDNLLNQLELPVFYRLLYSTGMRTTEARMLMRDDVDFDNGIININESKGYDQHRIAMHPSMAKILKRYDHCMDGVMPNRRILFPTSEDNSHKTSWVNYHFRQIWSKISNEPVRPYDLRSNYAVANITSWKGLGYEIHEKLFHLSRTMGHRSLSSTYWYFNLTPSLADKIRQCSEDSFNSLLPKLEDYEKEDQ